MIDNVARRDLKSKQILWLIASGGVFMVAVVMSSMLIGCDSNRTEPPPSSDASSIVTLDAVPTKPQKCTLFFFDTNSLRLAGEKRELHLSEDITERLKQTITALLGDPISGLYQTIPKGTFLHEVYIDDQSTAYLDFSHHLKDEHIGGTTGEALTVSAILRTIKLNFPSQIRKVQILIEGLATDTIGGHIDISKPLSLSLELEVVSGVAESVEAESTTGAPMQGEAEPAETESVEEESAEIETLETSEVIDQGTEQ